MKKIKITKEEYEKAKNYQKRNKNKNVDRKLKVIMLRYEGYSNSEIAFATNYTQRNITKIITAFKEEGHEEFVKSKYKANHRNLSEQEEDEILKTFEEKAKKGQVVSAWEIKQEFDKKLGRDTGRGYIYMLLERKQWRKVMPRSKHPKKANEEAIEASKKLTMS